MGDIERTTQVLRWLERGSRKPEWRNGARLSSEHLPEILAFVFSEVATAGSVLRTFLPPLVIRPCPSCLVDRLGPLFGRHLCGAGRPTTQAASATKDAASSLVSSREYLLKPLEKVYQAVAFSCPGSALVSFHHTSDKLRALDPPLAHSADNNVLLTPPSPRCLYPLNSFSLNNASPRSVASSSHAPAGVPHLNSVWTMRRP